MKNKPKSKGRVIYVIVRPSLFTKLKNHAKKMDLSLKGCVEHLIASMC